MTKKDLFYQDVEGRMEEMKQQPIKKEKSTRGEKSRMENTSRPHLSSRSLQSFWSLLC